MSTLRCIAVLILSALAMATRLPTFAQAAEPADASQPTPPNILFILVDNLGPDWIDCYGSDEGPHTPNIDRLAKQGLRFEHCYVTPYCSTTRVELMTGRYGFRTGWTIHHDAGKYGGGNFSWEREVSFPRLLKDAGYRTGIFGKWQINNLQEQPDALTRHGFDDQVVWPDGIEGHPAHGRTYWDMYITKNGKPIDNQGRFADEIFTDEVIKFLRANRDRPFFAYYSTILCHTPPVTTPLSPDEKAPDREKFAGMVRYVDHIVARLVGALDELKLRDNTIVIFSADNGTNAKLVGSRNGKILKGGVGSILEPGIDIPLIVNCPKLVPGGRVSGELVDYTDMLPTLVELAGGKLPQGVDLDGRSFATTIRGEKNPHPRDWVFSYYADDRAVRDQTYKLYANGRLYDLSTDPGEKQPLTADTSAKAARAREKLQAVLDSFPKDAELGFLPRSQDAFRMRGER